MFSHDILQGDVQELEGNSWVFPEFQHFHLLDVDFGVLGFHHKFIGIFGCFMAVEIVGADNWSWDDFFDLREGIFEERKSDFGVV